MKNENEYAEILAIVCGKSLFAQYLLLSSVS